MESLELNVELPMVLEMDNSGTVDISNSWSVGGRTRHVDIRNSFLRELKDQGMLVIKHIPGDSNDANIFTKNVMSAIFNRHIPSQWGAMSTYHKPELQVGRLCQSNFVLKIGMEVVQ